MSCVTEFVVLPTSFASTLPLPRRAAFRLFSCAGLTGVLQNRALRSLLNFDPVNKYRKTLMQDLVTIAWVVTWMAIDMFANSLGSCLYSMEKTSILAMSGGDIRHRKAMETVTNITASCMSVFPAVFLDFLSAAPVLASSALIAFGSLSSHCLNDSCAAVVSGLKSL